MAIKTFQYQILMCKSGMKSFSSMDVGQNAQNFLHCVEKFVIFSLDNEYIDKL